LAALDAGHAVVATVRGEHTLPEHERLTVRTLDVRDRQAARETVEAVAERFGRLDVLVNNAGYGLIGAIEEVSEEEARSIIDTNLLHSQLLRQCHSPIKRRHAAVPIVQICTGSADGTKPTFGLNCETKFGPEALRE